MADQLWIVLLDGVAQTGVLPFADSEEKALAMWREQARPGPIARARLRAIPKAGERAATALVVARNIARVLADEGADIEGADFIDHVSRMLDNAGFLAEARAASSPRPHPIPRRDPALAIVLNIALALRDEHVNIDSGDFLDYVSGALDAAGFLAEARADADAESGDAGVRRASVPRSRREALRGEEEILTADEHAALRAWANEEGPRWKAALRLAWETGDYRGSEHDAALQQLRNRLGPSWLAKHRLPLDPTDETTGYHCWVVTSKKPYQTRTWVATRRAEAVSRVKDAVRDHKTEGGVHSRDPGKPFEVAFSLLRGKLLTTKFTD